MRMRLAFAALLLALTACDTLNRSTRPDPRETAHERYARGLRDAGLANAALGREWLAAADTVLRAPLRITLPHHETGYYDRSEARAVGWQFTLRDGQRITVTITHNGQTAQLFTDLFVQTSDTAKPFALVASGVSDSTLRYDTRDSAIYVLRVQPELLRSGRYEVTIQNAPLLAFPVEGRGNSAAQSFYGVDRDAGARQHKGIDIFAPRGTPVLAVTDGRIISISPNNLGGNVIWQSDDHRAQTLYYAHLDRHAVNENVHVMMGDTIGFVGNTGNARTTAPHLHFGIYRRGQGPVDPWPYVRRVTATVAAIRVDTSRIGRRMLVQSTPITLRSAPSAGADSVAHVKDADVVWVKGAAVNFYRVELPDGTAGYVPATARLRASAGTPN